MQCIKCRSQNTQRLNVAYENGTCEISATSRPSGLFQDGHYQTTIGTHQSILARNAAPPKKWTYGVCYVIIFIGFWITLLGQMLAIRAQVFLGLLTVAIGIFIFRIIFSHNRKIWSREYKIWAETWLCLKCGHQFHRSG